MKMLRLVGEWAVIAVVFLAILIVGIGRAVLPPTEAPEHLSFDPPGQPLAPNSDAKLRADIQVFEANNPYRVH